MGLQYKTVDVNDKNVDEHNLFCLKSGGKDEGYKNKLRWFNRDWASFGGQSPQYNYC